jgi:hypothetical protein
MAPAAVLRVERLRVDAVEPTHSVRELLTGGLDDEVVVVSHQAEGMARPAEASDDVLEHAQEGAAIVGVAVDEDPSGAARGDVEEAVGEVAAP